MQGTDDIAYFDVGAVFVGFGDDDPFARIVHCGEHAGTRGEGDGVEVRGEEVGDHERRDAVCDHLTCEVDSVGYHVLEDELRGGRWNVPSRW